MINNYKYVIVIAVVFLALRLLYIEKNLFFGFEQGRDFLKLAEISSGNFTLIGPKTDIDGVFHGALSYYLILPMYLISSGNPYTVLFLLLCVHTLSLFALFNFCKNEVNKKFAYVAILIYSISYSSIVYSRWISNPNLVPPLTIFLLYTLQLTKQRKTFLAIAAVLWAVIFHLQVIAALILVFPIAYYVYQNKLLNIKNFIFSVLAVFAVLSSYFIFNIRNESIMFNSIVNFIQSEEGIAHNEVKLDEFRNETVANFYPENSDLANAMFLVTVLFSIWLAFSKSKAKFFLLLYFAAPLVFMILGVTPLRHLFMLNSLFVALIISYLFVSFKNKKLQVAFLLIILLYSIGNLRAIFIRLPESNRNFIHHAQRTFLYDELRLVDYIYSNSSGNKFSYDYYTVPYWQPDAWRYIFQWYGKNKYGYTPEQNRTNVYYVLIEPDEGQPLFQENWYRDLGSKSTLLDTFESGKLKVEKRQEI